MCGSKRSNSAKPVTVAPEPQDKFKVPCHVCTFINDLRSMPKSSTYRCEICGETLKVPTNDKELRTSRSAASSSTPTTGNSFNFEEDLDEKMVTDETFLLELVGFPSRWGQQALQECKGDPLSSIAWLLANKQKMVEGNFRLWQSFVDGKSPRNSQLPRSMREMGTSQAEASAPRTNPCFRILSNTWEPMVVMNDSALDSKAMPTTADGTMSAGTSGEEDLNNSAVAESFLTPSQLTALKSFSSELPGASGKFQVKKWLQAERNLRGICARRCMVTFLLSLPKCEPSLLAKLNEGGGFTKFLKLYLREVKPGIGKEVLVYGLKTSPQYNGITGLIVGEFFNGRYPVRIPNRQRPINLKPSNVSVIGGFETDPVFASGALSRSFVSALREEFTRVHAEVKAKRMIVEPQFQNLAPISIQLKALLLDQMLIMYRILLRSQQGGSVYSESHGYRKHLFLVRWVIEIFVEVIEWAESFLEQRIYVKEDISEYFGCLFSSHLIDGIVGLVIASRDSARTDLMQLLASIHHSAKKVVRLSLSRRKRELLTDFMFRTYKTQRHSGISGCFSPFFQALVELNVSIHYMQKVSERKLYKDNNSWFQDVLQVAECMNEGRLTDELQLGVWGRIARTDDLTDFLRINNSVFTRECDEELVDLVNRIYIKKNSRRPTQVTDLKLRPQEMVQFPNLQAQNIRQKEIKYRFHVLETLNQRIHTVIPLINLSVPPGKSSLADGIRSIRSIMFWSTKERLWTNALRQTECTKQEVKVTIDKMRALKFRQEKRVDFHAETVFGQVMSELKHASPRLFRIGQNQRAFQVVEVGFNSQDIGGPYRDTIEAITKELESSVLPLFVPCMNNVIQLGRNRDVFVPSPMANLSSWHKNRMLAMYEFVGKLMGLAIRTLNYHSFHFSEVVWKPLVYDKTTMADITSIDSLAFKTLDEISMAQRTQSSPEAFNNSFGHICFTTKVSDGHEVELIPGGSKIHLTWNNRTQYLQALTEYKLNEYRVQSDAMRRGLATVVPYQILSLFTWKDLQDLVCGRITVDVGLLKSMTRYAGWRQFNRGPINAFSPHVQMFWKMMKERMDNVQRSKLLFFIWGRSRLPVNKQGFERTFTIMAHPASQALGKNPDDYLPVAHTCFFQLELPEYSNMETMYQKIMFACTHCSSIDGDQTAAARAAASAGATVL